MNKNNRKKINKKTLIAFCAKHLIRMEDATAAIAAAWNGKQNVLFTGPGGYGKSKIAELIGLYFLEHGFIEKPPFILSFNKGTTEDKIFGGVDMQKFTKEGLIHYLVHSSFANSEYVILEEIFDADETVWSALKDVLTSGEIRYGDQTFKIQTKIVIACSNRSPEEVITDLSTAAMLERFLVNCNIVWSSHTHEDYVELYAKLGWKDEIARFVAKIVVEAKEYQIGKSYISPRTAVGVMKLVRENYDDLDVLNHVYGFTPALDKYRVVIEQKKAAQENYMDLKAHFENFLYEMDQIHSSGSIDQIGEERLLELDITFPEAKDENVEYLEQLREHVKSVLLTVIGLREHFFALPSPSKQFQEFLDTPFFVEIPGA